MAKSPKTTHVAKDGKAAVHAKAAPIHKVSKSPSKESTKKEPKSILKEPKCISKESETSKIDADNEEDDDDYYHNFFFKLVEKELPVTDEEYPYQHLQDDIVCVIADIYEKSGYLVVPDSETVMKIAKMKIKDSKTQNEFIFGNDKDSGSSIYSVIKKYTDVIRQEQWSSKYE